MCLAIYSLSFYIRNLSGPYNIFGIWRSKLFTNPKVGVFFYELFSCPFCIGFHCGYIIYTLQCSDFHFNLLILWGLAGSAVVAILDLVLERLVIPTSATPAPEPVKETKPRAKKSV
jgi:hypothetical protein